MIKWALALAGLAWALAVMLGTDACADFSHVEVEHHDTSTCVRTFRLYAVFTDPQDQLLAVSGNQNQLLEFASNVPLFNDGDLISGLIQEDKAMAPVSGPQDSWVTIDADDLFGNDTSFSPGFAGGDGIHAVVVGTEFEEHYGGWFDSDPSTPVTGTEILIAQFSLEAEEPLFALWGNIDWKTPEGALISSTFNTDYDWDVWPWWCPAADLDGSELIDLDDLLILLANWGPCAGSCCLGDFDDDGAVDVDDLLLLLSDWGPCDY